MRTRALFSTSSGALRAPWRIALFLAATIVAVVVLQAVFAPLVVGAFWFVARVRLSVYFFAMAAALIVAHVIALKLDGSGDDWSSIGLGPAAATPALLARGFAIGAIAIAIPIVLLLAAGWLHVVPAHEGSSIAAAARLLVFLAPAALWEELLVRGYAFSVIRVAIGAPAAVLITSLVFGFLHLQNAGANLQTVGQVVFAGVWLAGVLLATGSLYAAWMAHLAWNWTMAAIFHAPVSGLDFALPVWRLVDAGPDWATGGAWGPEGGLAATAGMALTLTYLMSRRPRREES